MSGVDLASKQRIRLRARLGEGVPYGPTYHLPSHASRRSSIIHRDHPALDISDIQDGLVPLSLLQPGDRKGIQCSENIRSQGRRRLLHDEVHTEGLVGSIGTAFQVADLGLEGVGAGLIGRQGVVESALGLIRL